MSADSYANCPKCGEHNSVREDYEQGIVRGEYFVDYHGKCNQCGFTHTFQIKQRLGSSQQHGAAHE